MGLSDGYSHLDLTDTLITCRYKYSIYSACIGVKERETTILICTSEFLTKILVFQYLIMWMKMR